MCFGSLNDVVVALLCLIHSCNRLWTSENMGVHMGVCVIVLKQVNMGLCCA